MSDSFSISWRPFKKDWLLFSKNLQNKPKTPYKTSFFFSSRKPESKGSVIYTPEGYGIIQEIDEKSQKIYVKLSSRISQISQFSLQEVFCDIPLTLSLISRSFSVEEQITIPVHYNSRDLLEKIENSLEKSSCFSMKTFFKGRELSRNGDSLEKLGILPHSKIIVISSLGKPFLVNRFTTVYQGWGYSNSIDGVSFSPTKDIRIMGFGLYTPEKEKTALSGILKFIQGNDVKNTVVFMKEFTVFRDENDKENKISRIYLDRPYKIKSGDIYSCVVEISSGNSFYGSNGQAIANGEQDVAFSFTDCVGSINGTSPTSGQIPEIYYFV